MELDSQESDASRYLSSQSLPPRVVNKLDKYFPYLIAMRMGRIGIYDGT